MTEQYVTGAAAKNIARNKKHATLRKMRALPDRVSTPYQASLVGVIGPDEYRSLTTSEQFVLKHPDWHKSAYGRWAKKRLEWDPDYFRRGAKERAERKRSDDPDSYYESRWAKGIKANFGLSVEQYEAMLVRQGGGCALCGKHETATRRRKMPDGSHIVRVKRLAVDHDHETGRVRGLLCQQCNIMLGASRENLATLRMAIRYLTEEDR